MSGDGSDLARLMRILDQVSAQAADLPSTSRAQRRAAARSALRQARAEARASSESTVSSAWAKGR
jgi:hypothetical protein